VFQAYEVRAIVFRSAGHYWCDYLYEGTEDDYWLGYDGLADYGMFGGERPQMTYARRVSTPSYSTATSAFLVLAAVDKAYSPNRSRGIFWPSHRRFDPQGENWSDGRSGTITSRSAKTSSVSAPPSLRGSLSCLIRPSFHAISRSEPRRTKSTSDQILPSDARRQTIGRCEMLGVLLGSAVLYNRGAVDGMWCCSANRTFNHISRCIQSQLCCLLSLFPFVATALSFGSFKRAFGFSNQLVFFFEQHPQQEKFLTPRKKEKKGPQRPKG
jgi:hypothetical protein